MIRTILIALLFVAVAGTGYWGYTEHQEKNAILLQAENNYQRAFHDLNFHVDSLHDKIGETLAMNSRNQLSPALAQVWRLTSEAHNDVGQLPLALLPFNKTEEFLAKMGEFSYRTAVRDLDKNPLSDKEYKTLKDLYANAKEIQNELRRTESLAQKNNLRWMDVEMALATNKTQEDNTIIDGFKTVDKNVEGYSEVNFGPEVSNMMKMKNRDLSQLKGKKITKEEAKKIAIEFFDLKKNVKITVEKSGKDAKYDAYSLTLYNPDTKGTTYMDITQKGGYPLYVLYDRSVGKPKISLNDAMFQAEDFLKKHMESKMEMVSSDQYDNIAVFTYARLEDDVRIYPEVVTVKVALDNGDIMGYEGTDFLLAHQDRRIPEFKITEKEARTNLNPKFEVKEVSRALIRNDINEEVFCYEFLGVLGNETYQVFINAENGNEEEVKKLKEAEPSYNEI
ncbi:germination protein YpeB [Fictibacillus arsenicus]|uniref:Germination protein YpeB n=1 Tax=Fictibacillus arsenicus TaxID=255247 RepID=A0A1V3G6D8_9BACL|nr:germination protein YpeB [Fictibacillus arsenicus]OOE10553.1 germination protein YpeB [Fictibacillus arsenicus]